jgi:hypothetical protein
VKLDSKTRWWAGFGVLVLGVLGIVAGVVVAQQRRHAFVRSKSTEAQNTLRVLERRMVHSFDIDENHRLCPSAPPVPERVPSGENHFPRAEDYQHPGWSCLEFSMTTPQWYQYEVRVGGPYKGPARGGYDPGPNGYEISAEGDLDGDGKTSLFTVVGQIGPNNTVRTGSEMLYSDEFE